MRVHVWKVRDELEQSDGSETTERPGLTLPRQALEISPLAVKNGQDKICEEQTVSIYLQEQL